MHNFFLTLNDWFYHFFLDKMSSWRKKLARFTDEPEDSFDAMSIKKKKPRKAPVKIECYYSYGNDSSFFVKGRLYMDKGIDKPSESHSTWRNLINMYKRFGSDELPYVLMRVTGEGIDEIFQTDDEGYFEKQLPSPESFKDRKLWNEITVEVIDRQFSKYETISAKSNIFFPSPKAKFGVISDIDDTIMITRADSVFRMVSLTILNNAHTRLAFRGVTSFYKSLKKGMGGNNPFFYVSSSPWNLFDFIVDFFELNRLPKGPFILRDYGVEESKFKQNNHHGHKFKEIEKILNAYPNLPFILIGDNGQHDPEIFTDVVKHFPERIKAVYIRDIIGEKRVNSVKAMQKELKKLKVDLVLFDRTKQAALHAIKKGYIDAKTFAALV